MKAQRYQFLIPLIIAFLCLTGSAVQAQNCTVNAGVPQSICGTAASLAGNLNGMYSGNAAWSFVSGPVTPVIASPASTNSQVTGMTASGVYTFRLSLVCQSGDTVSQNVSITAYPQPVFTAGTAFAFCGNSGSPMMNATLPAGWTGTWSVEDATSGSNQTPRFTFSDIHSPTSTVQYTTPGCPLNSYNFRWEITSPNGLCKYSKTVHGVWRPDPATLNWNIPPVTACMGSIPLYNKNGGCGFWSGYNPDYVFTTSMVSAPAGFSGNVTIGTTVGGDIGLNGLTMPGHYVFNATLNTPCGNKAIGPFDVTVLPPAPTVTGSTSALYCIKAIPSSVSFTFTLADSTTNLSLVSSSVPSGANPINVAQSGSGFNRTFTVTPNTQWSPSNYYLNFKAVSAQDTNGYCPRTFTALITVFDSLSINMAMPDMNVCIPTNNTTVNATVTLPGYAPYLTADYGPQYRLTKLSGPSAGPATLVATWYATTAVLPGLAAGQYTYKVEPLANSPFAQEMACSLGPYADTFSINVYNATGANAGTDQNVFCIQNYALAGNTILSPSYGTWSQVSGPTTLTFTNAHRPTSRVGNAVLSTMPGVYVFRWATSDSNNACPVYADTVVIIAQDTCAPFLALPTHMTAFSVEKIQQHARLLWTTGSEEDLKEFAAEWSTTGRGSDWITIGTVAPTGRAGSDYFLNHTPAAKGINYYRIRQVDKSGRYEYSYTAKLAFDGSIGAQVYPNPVTDRLNVSNLESGSKLRLYGPDGRLLLQTNATSNAQQIDMNSYAPGVYLLHIAPLNGNETQSHRIIKK